MDTGTLAPSPNQSDLPQNAQVLGYRRLRDPQAMGQGVDAQEVFTVVQQLDDPQPGGIRQRFQIVSQLLDAFLCGLGHKLYKYPLIYSWFGRFQDES